MQSNSLTLRAPGKISYPIWSCLLCEMISWEANEKGQTFIFWGVVKTTTRERSTKAHEITRTDLLLILCGFVDRLFVFFFRSPVGPKYCERKQKKNAVQESILNGVIAFTEL